jgi:hypothetical protein
MTTNKVEKGSLKGFTTVPTNFIIDVCTRSGCGVGLKRARKVIVLVVLIVLALPAWSGARPLAAIGLMTPPQTEARLKQPNPVHSSTAKSLTVNRSHKMTTRDRQILVVGFTLLAGVLWAVVRRSRRRAQESLMTARAQGSSQVASRDAPVAADDLNRGSPTTDANSAQPALLDGQNPRGAGWSPAGSPSERNVRTQPLAGTLENHRTPSPSGGTRVVKKERPFWDSVSTGNSSAEGVIRGEVRGFQARNETFLVRVQDGRSSHPEAGIETVWNFRLDRYSNARDRLSPMP